MSSLIVFFGGELCLECKKVMPSEEIKNGYCDECRRYRRGLIKKELEMSDQRAVSQAAYGLLERMKNLGTNQQVLNQLMTEFTELNGGPTGLAKQLQDDFNRARGVGLTEAEALLFERSDAVIQKYWQLIGSLIAQNDKANHLDLSGLTEEELQATVAGVAIDEVKANPEFAKAMIRALQHVAPELFPKTIDVNAQPVLEPEPSYRDQHDED